MMQDQSTEQASKIGAEHGRNAATWVFDGNKSDETYRTVLAGIQDGDPLVMDAYRVPSLSGEYADDYDETSLRSDLGYRTGDHAAEDFDEAADAYNDAASEAFWSEVERLAREHVEFAKVSALQSAGFPVRWAFRPDEGQSYVSWHDVSDHETDRSERYVDLSSIARGDDTAGQSTTLDRSNFRTLMRDYPDTFCPISYANVDALGAFVADLHDELVTFLVGIREQYPVADDEDLSALENEEITDSWEQYVRLDITCEIPESHGDTWDALTADEQRETFWAAVDAADAYPEHDGHDVCWRYGDILPALVEAIERASARLFMVTDLSQDALF